MGKATDVQDVAHQAPACVVLVEDDLDAAQTLCTVLSLDGYDVRVFHDARRALHAMKRGRIPDVILLDLWMPSMEAWQFRLEQRLDPQLARVPLIAMSADRSAVTAAIDADHVLAKPVSRDDVLRALRHVLGRTPSEAPTHSPHQDDAHTALDEWNASYLLRSELRDARGLVRHLALGLDGLSAARAGAVDLVLRRAEGLTDTLLSPAHTPPFPVPWSGVADCALQFATQQSLQSWSEGELECCLSAAPPCAQAVDPVTALAVALRPWPGAPAALRFSLKASAARRVNADWALLVQLLRNVLRAVRTSMAKLSSPALDIEVLVDAKDVHLRIVGCWPASAQDGWRSAASAHGSASNVGVAVARLIAVEIRGWLHLEDVSVQGHAIHLSIPRASKPSLRPDALPRILVIEEPARAAQLGRQLASAFHVRVTTPHDAVREATLSMHYDIVVCCLEMTSTTGLSVLAELTTANPALAERIVMLVPAGCRPEGRRILEDFGIWHVEESIGAADLVSFLMRLVRLWRELRLR